MAEKANLDTWDEIQKNSQGDWFILDEDDGEIEVELLGPHYVVEPGDKDLAGRIWDKEWAKNEIEALVDGEKKYMSFAWPGHPFLRKFVARCKKNKLSPDNLAGTIWEMQKTGEWDYSVEYIGRKEDSQEASTASTSETKEESKGYKQVKNTVISLKDEPELANGKPKSEFISLIALKAKMPKRDIKDHFENVIKEDIVKEVDDKIVINE